MSILAAAAEIVVLSRREVKFGKSRNGGNSSLMGKLLPREQATARSRFRNMSESKLRQA